MPHISDIMTRKRWNMIGIDMIRNNSIKSEKQSHKYKFIEKHNFLKFIFNYVSDAN